MVLSTVVYAIDVVMQSLASTFTFITERATHPAYETLRDYMRKEPGGPFQDIIIEDKDLD
jgi:hypothetical protein